MYRPTLHLWCSDTINNLVNVMPVLQQVIFIIWAHCVLPLRTKINILWMARYFRFGLSVQMYKNKLKAAHLIVITYCYKSISKHHSVFFSSFEAIDVRMNDNIYSTYAFKALFLQKKNSRYFHLFWFVKLSFNIFIEPFQ